MASDQQAIAEALSISVATVSRSLKNHPAISLATRARVADAALRMGYRRRGDKPMRVETHIEPTGMVHLGVLCRGSLSPGVVHNNVVMRLIQGMSVAARAKRVALQIEYLAPDEFDHLNVPSTWPAVIRERVISGLALFADPHPDAVEALSAHLPCLQFVSAGVHSKVDCVTEDNAKSIAQLFNHLRAFGHEQIGMADFGYHGPSAKARLGGYVQSLLENNMVFDPQNATFLAADPSVGEERLQKIADHVARRVTQGVTAWICDNDFLGYSLMGELQRRGLRVPSDVSICGFDNFAPPPGLPKLTSIDGPFETMGEAAVARLLRRAVQGSGVEPVHIMYGCRLIEGESTGPVR